jgi:drug/metabolite transporter (DMT)-like permease
LSTPIFLMILGSAALHAIWNYAARRAAGNLGALWLGMCAAGACCLPLAIIWRESFTSLGAAYPYMLATGAIHGLYFVLLGKAYKAGEISFVYPVARGSGVAGAAAAAWVLLGEAASPLGAAGIVAVSLGILALGISDFAATRDHRAGLLALAVGATIVCYSLVDKVGVSLINPVLYVSSLFWLSALFSAPYVITRHRQDVRQAWRHLKVYVLVIGPGSLVTYLVILFAMQVAKVSYVVAVRECSVVIGTLMGRFLLQERLTPARWVGIAAVVLGTILVRLGG